MKNILPFFSALIAASAVHAQITVSSSNIATLGDTVFLSEDTLHGSDLDLGSAAGGQIWDFTILEEHKPDGAIIEAPNTAPLYTNFPDADWVLNDLYEDSVHIFFKQTNSYIDIVGFVEYDSTGNPALPDFNLRHRYMEFPATYGATYASSYFASQQVQFLGVDPDSLGPHPTIDSLRTKIYWEVISEIDAWGDLMLPVGTYLSLRQHFQSRVKFVSDWYGNGQWQPLSASIYLGFIDSVQYDTADNSTYRWWSDNEHANFWVAEIEVDSNDVASDTISYSKVQPKYPVGTEDHDGAEFSVYPNPVSETLTISGTRADQSIRLYDIHARIVSEQSLNGETTQLNVSEHPDGQYLLQITDENGINVKLEKLVIKH